MQKKTDNENNPTNHCHLSPDEVAMIIKKITGGSETAFADGNASAFAAKMGVKRKMVQRWRLNGITNAAVAWAFRAIDHYPHLVGRGDLGHQKYVDGQLSIIADMVGAVGLKQARALLLDNGLQDADARALPPIKKAALARLNSYHEVNIKI